MFEELAVYVAAEESGKSERSQLGNSNTLAGVRRRSSYRSRANSQDQVDTQKKCVNCGGGIHGSGSYAERLQSCPAQGKTYGRCLKKNHFSPVCRSKDAGQGPVSQNQILSGVSNSLQAAAETGGMDNGAHGAITSGAGNGIWEEW